jgi:hypothetical protein
MRAIDALFRSFGFEVPPRVDRLLQRYTSIPTDAHGAAVQGKPGPATILPSLTGVGRTQREASLAVC